MIPNPAIYDQNEGEIARNLLPINKRQPIWISWLTALNSAVQYDHDLLFNTYADGSNYTDWLSGTTYNYGDRVRYDDNAVYEMVGNSGYVSTIAPNLDTDYWFKVADTFIGVRERARYTGQKLMMEYALNRWFRTTFRQPSVGVSDIYIVNAGNIQTNFWLSNGNGLVSYMSNSNAFQRFYLGNSYTFDPFDFTIYIPVAVYVALNPTPANREGIVRAQADKYCQAGKRYKISTY